MPPVTPPSEGLDTTEIDAEAVRSVLAETSADHPPFEPRSAPYPAPTPTSETFRERVGLPDHPEPFYRRQMTWVIAVFCLIAILFAYPRLRSQELDTGPRITTIQVDPAAPSGDIADGQNVPRASSSGGWFDVDKPTTTRAQKKSGKPRAKAAPIATQPVAVEVDEEADPPAEEAEEVSPEDVDKDDPAADCQKPAAAKTPIVETPIVNDACEPSEDAETEDATEGEGDGTVEGKAKVDSIAGEEPAPDKTANEKSAGDKTPDKGTSDPTGSKVVGSKATTTKDPSPATKPTVPTKQTTIKPADPTEAPKKPVGATTEAEKPSTDRPEPSVETKDPVNQDKEENEDENEDKKEKDEDQDDKTPTTPTTVKPDPDDDSTDSGEPTATTAGSSDTDETGDEDDSDAEDNADDAETNTEDDEEIAPVYPPPLAL